MITTKTIRVPTAAILTLALLGQFLAPLTVLAEPTDLPPIDTSIGPPTRDTVGQPGGPAGPPSELAPLPPGRPKDPAQILAEARRDDARACQAESTAGTGISALKPESLQNGLAEDIGQALPPIVNDALTNDLPRRLQTALQRELPSIVSDGLRRELPQRLAEKIQLLNQTQLGDFENEFPTLLNDAISEALPGILTDGIETRLPRLVGESVRGSLGARLGPGLNNAAEIFVRAEFGGRIGGQITEIFGFMISYIGDLLNSVNASIEGLRSTVTALQSSLTSLTGILSIPGQINQLIQQINDLVQKATEIGQFITWLQNRQANQEQMTEDIIKGLTVTIQESLTQGDTMDRLTDALAADMTGPIIRSLEGGMDDITAAFLGPVNRALGSIENLPNVFFDPIDEAVDGLINTATGVIDAQIRAVTQAFTGPIDAIVTSWSQTIEQTMTAALQPITGTLTGAVSQVSNSIAFRINTASQQINDYFLGNTDVTLTPGSGSLYPNSYYQSLQAPPAPLDPTTLPGYTPGVGEIGSPLAGPPAELPLADTISGVASDGAGAAAGATQGIAEQAVNNQITADRLTGNIGTTLAQGLTGSIAAGLGGLVAGVPFVGGALQNIVTNAVNQAAAALGLSAGIGLAVPTMEIGALLATEQSTNQITGQIKGINEQMKKTQDQILKLTAEIKSLQIESCTYLKTIRRIQLAFEAKEFVQDPDAKKALGRAIEYHNRQLFTDLQAWRATTPGLTGVEGNNGEPLVPKNLNEHLAKEQREATGVFLDELSQTESPFKDDIKAKLQIEQTETFADRIKPTLSQDQYQKITSGQEFSWDNWLELVKPQNTPAGAEFLAREELARRQALAEANAREELLAGLGFLNTRQCAEGEMTDSGYCRRWETGTPGSVSQGYAVEGLTSVIRKTENTEILDDYITPELETNLERLKDISDYSGASEGTVYNQPDPCPGPGPCPDSGWGKIPAPRPAGTGYTTPAPPAPVAPTQIALPQITDSGAFTPLTLELIFDTPILTEVNDGAANATVIRWQSPNADECYANNNWLSGSTASAPAAGAGSRLAATGDRRIAHPVDLDLKITRLAAGGESNVPLTKTETVDKLRKKIIFDARTVGDIQPDDVYQIVFTSAGSADLGFEVGGSGKINPATPATVVQLIQREIANLLTQETALASELAKYIFTGFSGGGILISIFCLILLSGFSLLVRPNISFADHDRFHTLEQDLEAGRITEQDYNRLYQEEVRLQRLQTDIDYIRRQLQDPSLTPERRQELEAQLASKQQEIRSGGRTQDANKQVALAAATGKCGWTTFWNCVPELISAVGEFFKQIFGLGLWLVGQFFDKSVEYSITSFSTLANSASVQIGWKTLRDLANLFFIFILLYAAIGMILQLPSINGRRILVSVIIVALLINFSAFFTRLVIDVSNVAATQFYNAVSKSETARIGVGEGQLEISGISATFMNALPIHSVLASAPGRGIINAIGLSFGAVIMMLVAIFVFLTAAILFVVRTVILLFVIILSPLAFLMSAFPNQKGLFDRWLDTLLKQAFFAPLYLLMVWVTIKFLKGGALEQILAQGGSSPVLITLNFLVAIGFMFGALIIAKNLGAKGASGAMGIGKKLAGYGTAAMYTPIRGIGRGIKHKVQTGLGQLEAGRGRIGGTATMKKLISVIPYARAGMQRAAGAYRAEVAKKGEDFSRLKTSEMLRRLDQTGIFPTTRMAMLQAIAKKDDLDEVPVKELQKARKLMQQVGVSTTAMEKLRPDAGENQAEIEKMVARHKQPDIAKLHRVIVSGEGANDIVDKEKNVTRREALISAMINQYDGGTANAVIRRGDAISDAFLTKLLERANAKAVTKVERSSEQIIKYLEENVLKPINDKLAQKQGQLKQIETIPETQKTRDQKKGLKKEIDDLRVQAGKIASHARSYKLGNTRRDAGLDEFAGKKGPGPKTTPPATANQPGAPAGGVGI
ncbi:MAG: hypothetical protein HYT46_02785 [Candidatus Vogelbacteria bacterium]|nr:hypothetical protein [Candidatus Vogelbacteria bacterium]